MIASVALALTALLGCGQEEPPPQVGLGSTGGMLGSENAATEPLPTDAANAITGNALPPAADMAASALPVSNDGAATTPVTPSQAGVGAGGGGMVPGEMVGTPAAGTMPMGEMAGLADEMMDDLSGTSPTGMVGNGMADSGMPDAEGTPRAMREDLGEGDGSDVITIGDSWMNSFIAGIQQSLLNTSKQPYRVYGVGGTRLLSEQIPNQYGAAKNENPDVKTVIMTGGGNDIIQVPGLQDDCDAGGEQCGEVVTDILDRLSTLWAEMASDGVQDVIYVMYSTPEGENVNFELPDGDSAEVRCENVPAPLRCHTLNTVDIVMGDIPNGIHPSSAGFDRIAVAVYVMMEDRGMRR